MNAHFFLLTKVMSLSVKMEYRLKTNRKVNAASAKDHFSVTNVEWGVCCIAVSGVAVTRVHLQIKRKCAIRFVKLITAPSELDCRHLHRY